MKQGTQIAYIPRHAKGKITHPDVEFGFVWKVQGNCVFCRYWRKGFPGILRTTANSESAPSDMVVKYELVPQWVVDGAIAMILEEQR